MFTDHSTNLDFLLLTCREVEQLIGLSRSTIYRKIRDGSFPAQVKVGAQAVRWRASDICTWIDRAAARMARRQKNEKTERPKKRPKKKAAAGSTSA